MSSTNRTEGRPRPWQRRLSPSRSLSDGTVNRPRRRASLERTNFAELAFAWAGSTRRGEAHYYRIQGPGFLVEYDLSARGEWILVPPASFFNS